MKKLLYGALASALILILCAGCSEALKALAGSEIGSQGGEEGEGGENTPVPGGGALTVGELIKGQNGGYKGKDDDGNILGTPGMRLFVLNKSDVDPTMVTTPATLGMWPKDKKFHLMGMSTGGYMNAGFEDDLFLYYDKPFAKDETFRFSARVRVTTAHGVSTGKGVHVGAYSPSYLPYEDDNGKSPGTGKAPLVDASGVSQVFNTGGASGSKGVGLFLRAEATPQFRLYYSSFPDGSTTAGNRVPSGVYDNLTTNPVSRPNINLTDLKVGKEYIYEITRAVLPVVVNMETATNEASQIIQNKMAYGFRLLDSKTYLPVAYNSNSVIGSLTATHNINHGSNPGSGYLVTVAVDSDFHPFGTPVRIHPALREQEVFAGVCVPGSNVEVSEIKIWYGYDNDTMIKGWTYRDAQDGDGIWSGGSTLGYSFTPKFETPYTTPAYVPANTIAYVDVTGLPDPIRRPTNGGDAVLEYTAALWPQISTNNYRLTITPVKDPDFAEAEIRYQIFDLTPSPMLSWIKNDPYTVPGVNDTAYSTFTVVFDSTQPNGTKMMGRYKIVARDLNLDVPGPDGRGAPDYSQKQTLPEFYLTVMATVQK